MAQPDQMATLTGMPANWDAIRLIMGKLRRWLRRRGVEGEWAYSAEPNPRDTGAHVHLLWRGNPLDATVLAEGAVLAGAGSNVDVTAAFAPPGTRQPELRYTLKAVLERPVDLTDNLWPAAAEFLDLNGGQLVHASAGFWIDWNGERVTGGVERARTIASQWDEPHPSSPFLEAWLQSRVTHERRDTRIEPWQDPRHRQSEPDPPPAQPGAESERQPPPGQTQPSSWWAVTGRKRYACGRPPPRSRTGGARWTLGDGVRRLSASVVQTRRGLALTRIRGPPQPTCAP